MLDVVDSTRVYPLLRLRTSSQTNSPHSLGLVVFVGVTLDRIQRLFLSRLPKLVRRPYDVAHCDTYLEITQGGTFPLSATLVLRLHQLLNGSNDAELPKNAVDSIMTLPQLSVGNLTGRDQVQHFMRFSIEYLRRAGLLDEAGRSVAPACM